MHKRILLSLLLSCVAAAVGIAQQPPQSGLRIVVIAGEGAVNIIQQKTAVAPIIEVRDRNNLPVPGVTVTFSLGSGSASFGGASTITATTNALGQATAAGFTPTAAGAVQINVTAAVQGQTISAAITQTNFATAAQAAQAGAAAGGGTSGSTAGAAGGAAGGGGIGLGTVAVVGGAVAGGAVVATQTELFGGEKGFIVISGRVFSTVSFGGVCSVPAGVGQAPEQCYGPPVGGAVVSTSLDSATATTDGAGNFDLTTTLPRSRIDECITYTLTITAAGHPTYTVNTRGFSGNQNEGSQHRQFFALNPPTPNFMGGC